MKSVLCHLPQLSKENKRFEGRLVCDFLLMRCVSLVNTVSRSHIEELKDIDTSDIPYEEELKRTRKEGFTFVTTNKGNKLSRFSGYVMAEKKEVATYTICHYDKTGHNINTVTIFINNKIHYLQGAKEIIEDLLDVFGVQFINVTRFDLALDLNANRELQNYSKIIDVCKAKDKRIKMNMTDANEKDEAETIYFGSAKSIESFKIYDKSNEVATKSGKWYIINSMTCVKLDTVIRMELRTNSERWAKKRQGAKVLEYYGLDYIYDSNNWATFYASAIERKGFEVALTSTNERDKPLTAKKLFSENTSDKAFKLIVGAQIKQMLNAMLEDRVKDTAFLALCVQIQHHEAQYDDELKRKRAIEGNMTGYTAKKIEELAKKLKCKDRGLDVSPFVEKIRHLQIQ